MTTAGVTTEQYGSQALAASSLNIRGDSFKPSLTARLEFSWTRSSGITPWGQEKVGRLTQRIRPYERLGDHRRTLPGIAHERRIAPGGFDSF